MTNVFEKEVPSANSTRYWVPLDIFHRETKKSRIDRHTWQRRMVSLINRGGLSERGCSGAGQSGGGGSSRDFPPRDAFLRDLEHALWSATFLAGEIHAPFAKQLH